MESETGANEEWSPIRDGGDHAGATVSVLTRAEGENGALLGLARGMIVPLVKDDLSMVGGSLFVTGVSQENGTKHCMPELACQILLTTDLQGWPLEHVFRKWIPAPCLCDAFW